MISSRRDPLFLHIFHFILLFPLGPFPSVFVQLCLSDSDFFGCDFQQLIIPDVADGLLNGHYFGWDHIYLFIVPVSSDVCELFGLSRIDFDVPFLLTLPDYQSIVDICVWLYKKCPESL